MLAPHFREREVDGRSLLLVALAALLADAFTTYAALTAPGHAFREHTPTVAHLISAHGLTTGLMISVAVRFAVFGVVVLVARHVPKPVAWPLLACGYAGAAWTLAIAATNVWTMSRGA
jgi:hypothetical protein